MLEPARDTRPSSVVCARLTNSVDDFESVEPDEEEEEEEEEEEDRLPQEGRPDLALTSGLIPSG